jgi:hypothetical protein
MHDYNKEKSEHQPKLHVDGKNETNSQIRKIILLRPDVLCTMPSHPVAHVFLTLQWNSLGRVSFEVHESQLDVRIGKLVFQMLLRGECYENGYT